MIIKDILDWIASLPKWQQKLGHLIIKNKYVTEEDLDEIYDIFKIEMSLKDGTLPESDDYTYTYASDEFPDIKWKGVSNLHGVNRLQSGSKLNVSEGLTIIYGENGSGKSGYTRLLNKAFVSRGDQEILPDVFSAHPESLSANFQFIVDGSLVEYKFPESKNEVIFKTIRTFDSKSATNDMNRESAIDFAPSELSFFDLFLSSCTEIQKKLETERASTKIDNPILKFFTDNGEAYNQMMALSAHSEIDKIKETFTIKADEKDFFQQIKAEKASLIAMDIDKQISLITQVVSSLTESQKKFELFVKMVSADKIKIYNQQIEFLKKCKEIHDTAGLSLFKNDNIELIGTTQWKDFISYAKKYYDETSQRDKCPLCGHRLNPKDLIFKYWKYLESDAESNYRIAQEAIRISKEGLSDLDLVFLLESSIQKQWLWDNFKEDSEKIAQAFITADGIRNKYLEALENGEPISICTYSQPNINNLISKIVERKNGLNQDSITKRIAECERIENEYSEKIKVIDLLPTITSYIDYLKWDYRVEKSKVKTRSITNKQKELFEKYVTKDYLKTFQAECKKLNACFNIEIVSRGSSGQTLKKLQIQGTPPGKILSEGEQKAISIANFLTEIQMDSNNIGIVLDDPVCSLDHKRRSLIVNRLLDIAKERQVVVFTHEITFFMEMKTEAERTGVKFEQETIRKIVNTPGDISTSIPWQGMNVKERTGKLKNDLQNITALFNAGDTDNYYYEAKEWCELLRESWERAVEEILLNDAIQRYNPCVQTQRLKKAPFSQALYMELEKGMSDCSAWCHDQSRAINGNIPSADELKLFIDCFENFWKKHRK